MGRVGDCADNAAMESFFNLIQKNVLNPRPLADPQATPPGNYPSGSGAPTTADGDKTASLDSRPSSSKHSYKPHTPPDRPYQHESTKPGGSPKRLARRK